VQVLVVPEVGQLSKKLIKRTCVKLII